MSPKRLLTGSDRDAIRAVIDEIGAPVTLTDVEPDGRVRSFVLNKAASEFYGTTREATEGRLLDELGLRPAGRLERIKEQFRECLTRGESIQYRQYSPVETPRGRRWVHVTLSPLIDPAAKVNRVMSTIIDVTDLKRSEDELAEALTKILGGFVAICSSCKKIREEDESWQPVEGYISRRSEARFSHTMCPECSRTWYGEFAGE